MYQRPKGDARSRVLCGTKTDARTAVRAGRGLRARGTFIRSGEYVVAVRRAVRMVGAAAEGELNLLRSS